MSKDKWESVLSKLPFPDGNTPLAEAIDESAETLKNIRAKYKKIILLTDGKSNHKKKIKDVLRKIEAMNIECENYLRIYPIGIGKLKDTDKNYLKQVADSTFSDIIYYEELEENKLQKDFSDHIKKIAEESIDPNIEIKLYGRALQKQWEIKIYKKLKFFSSALTATILSLIACSIWWYHETSVNMAIESVASRIIERKIEPIKERLEDYELERRDMSRKNNELKTQVEKFDAEIEEIMKILRDIDSKLDEKIDDIKQNL
jgi:hypothetical protein